MNKEDTLIIAPPIRKYKLMLTRRGEATAKQVGSFVDKEIAALTVAYLNVNHSGDGSFTIEEKDEH